MNEIAYVEVEIEAFKDAFPDVDEKALGVIRLMMVEAYRTGFQLGKQKMIETMKEFLEVKELQ